MENQTEKSTKKKKFSSKKVFVLVVIFGFFLIALGGGGFWLMSRSSDQPGQTVVGQRTEGPDPEKLVMDFYEWYLGYQGNPLADKAYRERTELTDDLKQTTEELLASFEGGGYDPFLCAQNKPDRVNVLFSAAEGSQAMVELQEDFGSNQISPKLFLQKKDNRWQIDQVICPEPESSPASDQVVIYFTNPQRVQEGDDPCGLVFGVERRLPPESGQTRLEYALSQLFAGPSSTEKEEGYETVFPEGEDLFKSLKVEANTAYLDLYDFRESMSQSNDQCRQQDFFAQVEETLKHDRQIEKVIYAIDGDVEAFYQWMGIACAPLNNDCDSAVFESTTSAAGD